MNWVKIDKNGEKPQSTDSRADAIGVIVFREKGYPQTSFAFYHFKEDIFQLHEDTYPAVTDQTNLLYWTSYTHPTFDQFKVDYPELYATWQKDLEREVENIRRYKEALRNGENVNELYPLRQVPTT
jgi:hypothetical protein